MSLPKGGEMPVFDRFPISFELGFRGKGLLFRFCGLLAGPSVPLQPFRNRERRGRRAASARTGQRNTVFPLDRLLKADVS